MIEFILSVLGLGQAHMQRTEDRKLHAAAILARIEATVMEVALRLDYEIPRLRMVATGASIPPDMAVASLVTMREQCDQLRDIVENNRTLLKQKGANETVIMELERWSGTCSVMPAHADFGVSQIEQAIANGVGRQLSP